jgi:hypothetical protein
MTKETRPAPASGEDVERAREIWHKSRLDADPFYEGAHALAQQMVAEALTASRAQGRAEMREPLPCGHAAANIGDTGACEACNDMHAKYAQGRTERSKLDEAVVEWAREAVTAMEARAGWSLAHHNLRTALSARDAALKALPEDAG